jgi:hypothetical protein
MRAPFGDLRPAERRMQRPLATHTKAGGHHLRPQLLSCGRNVFQNSARVSGAAFDARDSLRRPLSAFEQAALNACACR